MARNCNAVGSSSPVIFFSSKALADGSSSAIAGWAISCVMLASSAAFGSFNSFRCNRSLSTPMFPWPKKCIERHHIPHTPCQISGRHVELSTFLLWF